MHILPVIALLAPYLSAMRQTSCETLADMAEDGHIAPVDAIQKVFAHATAAVLAYEPDVKTSDAPRAPFNKSLYEL